MALGKIKKENIDVIQACISIHSSNKKKKHRNGSVAVWIPHFLLRGLNKQKGGGEM